MTTRDLFMRLIRHASSATKSSKHVRCSFCGRSKDDVEKLVSGPGVYICDQCVKAAARILDDTEPQN